MATQEMSSSELGEWRYSTAYFNTAINHQILLELVCAPHTAGNYIKVMERCAGFPIGVNGACNQCNPQPPFSNVKWAARLIERSPTNACSAALWSTAGCLVSAFHCNTIVGDVAQFNVPPSTSVGFVVHPAPQDQYVVAAIEQAPLTSNADWAVIRLGRSAGLTAFQRQGELRRIGRAFTVSVGFPVRTVGYGTTVNLSGSGNGAQKDSPGEVVISGPGVGFTHDGFVQPGNSGGGVAVRSTAESLSTVEVLAGVVSRICDDAGGPPNTKCYSLPWPVRHAPFLAAIDSFCGDCIRDCDGDGVVSPADRVILVNWIATYNPMGDLTGNGFVDSGDLAFFDLVENDPVCGYVP